MTTFPDLEDMYTALETVEKTKGKLNQEQKSLFFLAYTLGYTDGRKPKDTGEKEARHD